MSTYGEVVRAEKVVCDLRSDTVTRPCADMRQAMANAEVGDDVLGEDPSVNELECMLAEMLGHEAGCFVSSGTQANLVAMLSHCDRGDEVITGRGYHVQSNEAVGASVLGGIAMDALDVRPDGALSLSAVKQAIKEDDLHYPVSRLVCLENTHDGRAIALEQMLEVSTLARKMGLAVHLDGARLFNASKFLNCGPADIAGAADTVSVCLSKGLGAPAGSVLLGPKDLMPRVRRNRKLLGGGMRQSGVLAAAGLYALNNNIARLVDDHERAVKLGATLNDFGRGEVSVRTNMVFYTPNVPEHAALRDALAARGVLIGGQEPEIRMVLHKDIDDTALAAAIEGFETYYELG